jgi:hypothetical protein
MNPVKNCSLEINGSINLDAWKTRPLRKKVGSLV